ncbi:hypothetical protein V3851_23835 [Paenibacillus sp. M1]|uniref:Uncharacterized protein n=1 Tax=Paenibacillus haidiansis TaxID=1574488 RepID=A0ABU7VYR8_9BACL
MRTFSNPTDPIIRLFALLNCVRLPVKVRAAAVVSGLSDSEVRRALAYSPDYVVNGEHISVKEPYEAVLERLEKELSEAISASDADWLYREKGCVFRFEAGQLINTFIESKEEFA